MRTLRFLAAIVFVVPSLLFAQNATPEARDIRAVLDKQVADWNRGDMEAFASGYKNSPDILFLQDTDGDGKADKREVVVTGFGRDDTHELPNSLTWGPDGWLYGNRTFSSGAHGGRRGQLGRPFSACL